MELPDSDAASARIGGRRAGISFCLPEPRGPLVGGCRSNGYMTAFRKYADEKYTNQAKKPEENMTYLFRCSLSEERVLVVVVAG